MALNASTFLPKQSDSRTRLPQTPTTRSNLEISQPSSIAHILLLHLSLCASPLWCYNCCLFVPEASGFSDHTMESPPLIELADAKPHSSQTSPPPPPPTPSCLFAPVSLKMLKPSVWGSDDPLAQSHAAGVVLSLNTTKSDLIVTQQAEQGNELLFLRFSLPLSKVSYSNSYTNNAACLVLETRDVISHEIVYSNATGSTLEREIERGIIQMNCTLSACNIEKGTKLAIQAKDESNETALDNIIQALASLLDQPTVEQQTGDEDTLMKGPVDQTLELQTSLEPAGENPTIEDKIYAGIWAGLESLSLGTTTNPLPLLELPKSNIPPNPPSFAAPVEEDSAIQTAPDPVTRAPRKMTQEEADEEWNTRKAQWASIQRQTPSRYRDANLMAVSGPREGHMRGGQTTPAAQSAARETAMSRRGAGRGTNRVDGRGVGRGGGRGSGRAGRRGNEAGNRGMGGGATRGRGRGARAGDENRVPARPDERGDWW